MNDPAILAAAFHDTPGLLAVRLSHPDQGAVAFAVTRRPDVGRGVASGGGVGCLIAAGVVATVLVVGNLGSCSHSDEPAALPAIASAQAGDAAGSTAWTERADDLGDDLQPQRPGLRPWAVRALLDVPRELARRGPATGGWLRPACAPADRLAHDRGRSLARQLAASGLAADTAVVLDLPGAQAVAAAAGMAEVFEPVFTSDSLPHPQGVVPAAQTLAAALFWRPELVATRSRRATAAPPCFILEGDRLAPYANQTDRFDNRSRARLPGAEALRGLGVQRLLYVRPRRGAVEEADDLNELFAALPAAGIEVRHLGLDGVEVDEPVEQVAPAAANHSAASWLWLRTGWAAPGAQPGGDPDPDATYRSRPRPLGPLAALDGGASGRSAVLDRLAARPPPRPSASGSGSGGSWFRSSSSHHGS